jgi:NADH-quinone oxidoreductase subunit A
MAALAIYTFLVAGLLGFLLVASSVLGPKLKTPAKEVPFECGSIPRGDIGQLKLPVNFYPVALAFLVFDAEIVFLLPLVMSASEGDFKSIILFTLFLALVTAGLIFELLNSLVFKEKKTEKD